MDDNNQDYISEDNPSYIPDESRLDMPLPDDRDSVLTRRNNVEFENQFDFKPLPKGIKTRLLESLFRLIPRKKKHVPVRPPVKMTGNAAKPLSRIVQEAKKQAEVPKEPVRKPMQPDTPDLLKKTPGMLMKEAEMGATSGVKKVPISVMPGTPKPLPQKPVQPRKQEYAENAPYPLDPVPAPTKQKFSVRLSSISKVNVLINGIALLIFAAGAYILYSELPTRPELIAGIVLVACASGVLAGRA
jgi:hypothetical protein